MHSALTSPHLARRSILTIAVAAALLLWGVALTTYAQLTASAHIVERAQGEALAGAIHAATRPRGGAAHDELLDDLLDAQQAYGMRAIALYGADGALRRSAGDGGPWPAAAPPDDERRVSASRTWRIVRIPAHHQRGERPHRPPPHDHAHPHRPPRRPGPREELAFIIEYEPAEAARLTAAGQRLVSVTALASALLVLGAWWLARMMGRAEEARHAQAQAAHLAHVGQMSATLAHEIRTPLTALKGHAQLLEATLPADTAPHKKASRVVAEAQRLERLIEGLLAFVRSGRVAREQADPTLIAQQAIEQARADVTLDAALAPPTWPLDPARVEQALRNLIENAARESASAPIELRILSDGAHLIYRVGDRGPGISDEVAARLAEPFFTTHASGTGLGLAVADSVARAHGGSLSAQNRDGGGAWFTLSLAQPS